MGMVAGGGKGPVGHDWVVTQSILPGIDGEQRDAFSATIIFGRSNMYFRGCLLGRWIAAPKTP